MSITCCPDRFTSRPPRYPVFPVFPVVDRFHIKSPITDEEYERYYALRWKLLRAPWHQPRGSERDEHEDDAFHVMACLPDGSAIGIGRLHFNSPHEAQIRFMAVEPAHQRQGIGQAILSALEQYAAAHGALLVVLHARQTAAGFYQSNGYRTVAPSHTLFDTIPHCLMEKQLHTAS